MAQRRESSISGWFGDVQTPNAARVFDTHAQLRRLSLLKYGVAWLLGVPLGLLVVIYLIFHLL
jgi:hypothetical protein